MMTSSGQSGLEQPLRSSQFPSNNFNLERKEFIDTATTYLEYNEVYDLFDSLLKSLIVNQPDNPIEFLVQQLQVKGTPPVKVVIIGPPGSGRSTQSARLAKELGLSHICVGDLLRKSSDQGQDCQCEVSQGDLVDDERVTELVLREIAATDGGWVLDGFPRTRVQAQALRVANVIPDRFIVLHVPDEMIKARFSKKLQRQSSEDTLQLGDNSAAVDMRLQHYYRHLMGVLQLYEHSVHQIDGTLGEAEIWGKIMAHLSIRPYSNAPLRPHRLCVLGSAGSGRTTLAKSLHEHYGAVHVDVAVLLRELMGQRGVLSDTVRGCVEGGTLVPDAVICDAVLRRLRNPECVKKGWVLDGFPKTAAQAQFLLKSHLVPSRVLHLDIAQATATNRLSRRMHDPYTNEVYYTPPEDYVVKSRLIVSQFDREDRVIQRHKLHFDNIAGVLAEFPNTQQKIDCDEMAPQAVFDLAREFIDRPLGREQLAAAAGARAMDG